MQDNIPENFRTDRMRRTSGQINFSGTETGRSSSSTPNAGEIGSILRSALPEMMHVKSTNIYSVGYNEAEQTMYVLFSKDAPIVYRYQKVDPEVYRIVLSSESVGKAFAELVKGECAYLRLKLVGDGVAVKEGTP